MNAHAVTAKAVVVGPGEGPASWFQGNRITIKATAASTGGAFGLVESMVAFLPRGVPHTFVVEGNRPARLIGILTPGGGEAFFAEGGRPAGGTGFPPPPPTDLEQLRRVAIQFGTRIVGPPTPA